MPIRYWLFPSVDGDRVYFADDFVRTHRDILKDGYVPNYNEELEVTQTSPAGMNVRVGTGSARILGYRLEVYLDPETITIPTPDVDNDRIDRIVVRLRRGEANRDMLLLVKPGTPAANPVPPALVRDTEGDVYEISLAQVFVGAGVVQINDADITDERLDPTVCGVAGPRAVIVEAPGVTAGKVLTADGEGNTEWQTMSGFTNIRVFEADGTFVVPEGISKVEVEMVGGGGGARGAPADSGDARSGAGAGGYAKGIVEVDPLESVPVTIGEAGQGNTGSGNPGGTSSFGTYVSCTGGQPSRDGGTVEGPATVLKLSFDGHRNFNKVITKYNGSNNDHFNVIDTFGGKGANSPLGNGGYGSTALFDGDSSPGGDAQGYGAGGGGASGVTSTYQPNHNAAKGGNGSPGIVIVRW